QRGIFRGRLDDRPADDPELAPGAPLSEGQSCTRSADPGLSYLAGRLEAGHGLAHRVQPRKEHPVSDGFLGDPCRLDGALRRLTEESPPRSARGTASLFDLGLR